MIATGPRVGVLTASYPRWPGDPAGCFVADRVQELRAAGATVDVLVAMKDDPAFAAGAPEAFERAGGMERARLAALSVHASAQLLEAARLAGARWDAIESHWLLPCGVLGALVAAGRPHEAWAHGGDVALLERVRLGRDVARWLARSGAKLVFVSAELRSRFARLADIDASSLALGELPVPAFDAPTTERSAIPLVVGIGRLVPIKGFDVLVRAIGRLPASGRPRLALIGDGPERTRLQGLAHACDVDLRMLGTVTRAEVGVWLASSDLCALPSRVLPTGRSEGLPMVAREALALGRPVVAAATGGLAGLNTTPGVTLVPAEDPVSLSVAIQSVIALTRPNNDSVSTV